MLIKLLAVIIAQYIRISNHDVVHLKRIPSYELYLNRTGGKKTQRTKKCCKKRKCMLTSRKVLHSDIHQ